MAITMAIMMKDIMRRCFMYDILYRSRQRAAFRKWEESGKRPPPPAIVKQSCVKEYAHKYGIFTFIETGTYIGDMVHAVSGDFEEIYSIELNSELYNRAKRRFKGKDHITVLQGDSAKVLPKIIKKINRPVLFWLDGHYSSGATAKGEKNTPIMEELKHILGHNVHEHVILIDDARCFIGKDDYPSMETLRELTSSRMPGKTFEVMDDIIRIA
jgi:hypothetical protein